MKVDESCVPAKGLAPNRPVSFWKMQSQYILSGLFLVAVQMAAICGLLWQRARRRKSEEKFSKSFAQSPLAITIASMRDGRYLEINQTFELHTGWAHDEVIGRSPLDLNLWVDPPQRIQFLRDILMKGRVRDLEVRIRRKDGQIRTVLGSAELIEVNHQPCALSTFADITERKMAEEALAILSRRLIEVQEEERKRIAREIHDDYNQRLAMVAIELQDLAEKPNVQEASQRLRRLFDRVSEVGADLHSLSHSLHSSTLEALGLVAGIRAFCEEFSSQQGIEVVFVNKNMPDEVPAPIALCLFRIVQETLRNVKRHSGADRAEVRLEGLKDAIQLTVVDEGKGIDPNKPVADRGIGLRSMEERLRSLGGQLEVNSIPLKRTTITATLQVGSLLELPDRFGDDYESSPLRKLAHGD